MKIKQLLNYLQCPYCTYKKLILSGSSRIDCPKCGKGYKVVNEVPILMDVSKLSLQEKSQKAWFEDHYSHFSDRIYKLENWRLSVLKRTFETSFNHKVKTYLDVGCGATGYTVIEAAKRYSWQSFGIDISLEAMLRAKKLAEKQKVGDLVAFVVCSAENLPFKKNLFDYVSILSVLEHLKNDQKVIDSAAGICKKGGYCYVCVPNTYRKMWPFLWPVYYCFDRKIGHLRHYGIQSLNQKMALSGFKPKNVVYNGHLIKFMQLALDKTRIINNKLWWSLEEKDMNKNPMGVQLNAYYQKN